MALLYGLYDADNTLRYIGSTETDAQSRFAKHLKNAFEENRPQPVYVWMRSAEGVNIKTLAMVESSDRAVLEKRLIRAHDDAGSDLLNVWHTKRGSALMTEIGARPEVKAKRSASLSGLPKSDETRRKLSEARKKQPANPIALAAMHAANTGKAKTQETKDKISAALKGEIWSEKRRASASRGQHTRYHVKLNKPKSSCKHCSEGPTE